jgi:hypothetical protein
MYDLQNKNKNNLRIGYSHQPSMEDFPSIGRTNLRKPIQDGQENKWPEQVDQKGK